VRRFVVGLWSSIGLRVGLVCGSSVSLCDGLGWVSYSVGWVGLKELDPRTALANVTQPDTI